MRKFIKRVMITVAVLIPVSILAPFFIFPALNDIKAQQLADNLQNNALPEKTEIVEILSGCGNTGGTGNHTEIWAGVLIKTELSEDAINAFYGQDIAQKVDEKHKDTFIMSLLMKKFNSLTNVSDYSGYYIIEEIGESVSSMFDLRGH